MHLGDEIGPRQRLSPQADAIAAYAGASRVAERLFTESRYARTLGLPDVIVPGPMLAAFIEQFLRTELSEWRLERLSTTFRLPTPAGAALTLQGAITEHHDMPDGERLVCEVVIVHGTDSDRAVTGTATLWRPRTAKSPRPHPGAGRWQRSG